VSSNALIWAAESRRAGIALGEEDVVILIALERRIEIDEVYARVRDMPAEDVEIVAVVEEVVGHGSVQRHDDS
jgi:hypothetical protein